MHFVAGPWFTVTPPENDTWIDYGRVWVSDGQTDHGATLQYRVHLPPPPELPHAM